MKISYQTFKNVPTKIKATAAFFVCSIFQRGISVISTPIFTRILSAEEYGQFGVFSSWYDIFASIISLSMVGGVYTTALVKFEDDKRKLSSSAQGLIIFSSMVWGVLYAVLYRRWNDALSLNTVQMMAMFVMILTSASFGLWAVEQRVLYHYKRLVFITIIVSLAKPIVGIVFVTHFNDKVTARIIGLMIVELICYAWVIFFQLIRGKVFLAWKYWKYFIRFSFPLVLHALSQTVLSGSDRIMIQTMVGNKEVGYYNLAYSVALIMMIVNTSLSQTLAPWTYQKLKDRKEDDLNRITILSCVVIAVVNLGMIVIAPEIITIFAPKEYAEASYVIPPVAMSVYLMYLYDWFVRVEYYYEKTHYVLIASFSGAVVNIVLNYCFIPIFGYLTAGYTTFISYGVYTVLHYGFMRKICIENMDGKHIYNERQLLVITCIFVLLGVILSFTYNNIVSRYAIIVIAMIFAVIFRKKIFSIVAEFLEIRKIKG